MINVFIPAENSKKPLPDAFIESSIIYKKNEVNYIKIYFQIKHYADRWLLNKDVLFNTNLSMMFNNTEVYKKNLSSFIDNFDYENNLISGYIDIDCSSIDLTDLEISIFCSTKNIIGNKTIEKVFNLDTIQEPFFEAKSYKYITKHKDIRLLEMFSAGMTGIIDDLQNTTLNATSNEFVSSLYVSKNINKKASICFMFDLEKYLYKYSKIYKALSLNKAFKEKILSSLDLKPEDFAFYKKNISLKNQEYQKINSTVFVRKASKSFTDKKFFISINDDNEDKFNKNSYSIKFKVNLTDSSYEFLKTNIIDNLLNIKNFIKAYSQKLNNLSINKFFGNKDYRYYFYENEYLNTVKTNNLPKLIDDLSEYFALLTGNRKIDYTRMLVSCFNPLTYNNEIFTLLSNKIDELLLVFNMLLDTSQGSYSDFITEEEKKLQNPYFSFEHDFYKTNNYENRSVNYLDYNYDYEYGYEVISPDNNTVRKEQELSGTKAYTKQEFNARGFFELNKFFSSTALNSPFNLNYLSISSVDLGKQSYYFINSPEENMITSHKDLFINLCEYNNHKFDYDTINSAYFQLTDHGIYIKSISDRSNGSVNNLFKSTVFDPNLDTSQKSLQYVTDTGLLFLYHALPEYTYNKEQSSAVVETIVQSITSSNTLKNNISSSLYYKAEVTPDNNASLILLYENMFIQEEQLAGDICSLYSSKPVSVNKLFTDKLVQYNEHYLVYDSIALIDVMVPETKYDLENELLDYNIPSIYLGRRVEDYEILNSTEDI